MIEQPHTSLLTAPAPRPATPMRPERVRPRIAGARPQGAARGWLPGWMHALLSVPLMWKVAGANLLIVAGAMLVALGMGGWHVEHRQVMELLCSALLVGLVVDIALVYAALRPLWMLEQTAERVWHGDLDARVPASPLADRDMARVERTFNLLLDGLMADRSRMRQLAAKVVSAQDEERSRIARELHDSTAQLLAALMLQVAAARAAATDPEMAERLETVRAMAADAVEEVRTLSHAVHPRVLDDLGLPAALEWQARRLREQMPEMSTSVITDARAEDVPPAAAAVLYRVVQEALRNVVQHADAHAVRIALGTDGRTATLQVADDGRGFDVAGAEARRPGMGLFSMRERVALVDGRFEIESAPGRGTRVVAEVPLTP